MTRDRSIWVPRGVDRTRVGFVARLGLAIGVVAIGMTGPSPIAPVLTASVTRGSAVGIRAADYSPYGVNNDLGLVNYSVEIDASPEADLNDRASHVHVRQAGIGWVRYWLSWQNVEGTSDGELDWSRPDRDINAAIDEGLTVYVNIHTAPAWVHGGKTTYGWGNCGNPDGSFNPNGPWCGNFGSGNEFAPFDPGGGLGQSFYWKRFVRQAVTRYGDRVKYWAFGNEPGSQWHWPEYPIAPCNNRAVQFLDKVFKPGREAALEANPSVQIVGPEEIDWNFLHQLLSLEANGFNGSGCNRPPYGRLFDVVSIHAYQDGILIPAKLDQFKAVLNQFDRREVWLTETDANGHLPNTSLPELRKRGWLSKVFAYRMKSEVSTCVPGSSLLLAHDRTPCAALTDYQSFIGQNPPAAHVAGTTNAGDHLDFVLLQNPHAYTASATVRLSTAGGGSINHPVTLTPNSRSTLFVGSPGFGGQEQAVSIIPSNPWLPIWAEHADRWNNTLAGRASQAAVEKSDTWYFAEGSSSPAGGFWVEDVVAYNPSNDDNVLITWTYLNASGASTSTNWVVPPRGHKRMRTSDVAGVENDHSTIVSAVWSSGTHNGQPAPIAAERTISWGSSMDGHAGKGVPHSSPTWYFAEGIQNSVWDTYLLLMNPTFRNATVHVQYLLPTGFSGVYAYSVPARRRLTVAAPAFNSSFGIKVTSVGPNAAPIVAERSMYGINWTLGTGGEGTPAPSQRWLFPEGSTEGGGYWAPFFCLANPTNVGGNLVMKFRRSDGTVVVHPLALAPGQRLTIDPWGVSAALQNWAFATEVIVESATVAGQVPPGIVAERVTFWDATTAVHGAHVVLGTP